MRRMGWVWRNACCECVWQWNLLATPWCSYCNTRIKLPGQGMGSSFQGCNHKHIKLNAHKKCYLTTERKTNKSYCVVDQLLLGRAEVHTTCVWVLLSRSSQHSSSLPARDSCFSASSSSKSTLSLSDTTLSI